MKMQHNPNQAPAQETSIVDDRIKQAEQAQEHQHEQQPQQEPPHEPE